jgi:hypothetical protein
LSVDASARLATTVRAIARANRCSVSSIVRRALEAWLEQ